MQAVVLLTAAPSNSACFARPRWPGGPASTSFSPLGNRRPWDARRVLACAGRRTLSDCYHCAKRLNKYTVTNSKEKGFTAKDAEGRRGRRRGRATRRPKATIRCQTGPCRRAVWVNEESSICYYWEKRLNRYTVPGIRPQASSRRPFPPARPQTGPGVNN